MNNRKYFSNSQKAMKTALCLTVLLIMLTVLPVMLVSPAVTLARPFTAKSFTDSCSPTDTQTRNTSTTEPPEPEEPDRVLVDTIQERVLLEPGEDFFIHFTDNYLRTEDLTRRLPPECREALDATPQWLRENLTHKFLRLSPGSRSLFAEMILDIADLEPLHIDEVAFVIAHSSVETLEDDYFFPELIPHNARLIYDIAPELPYVNITEKGDHTTLTYRLVDGESLTLPRDIYYWYVVHPDLSDELPTYVDPEYDYTSQPPFDRNYGTPPPVGKYWRDYFYYHNDTGYPLLKDRLSTVSTMDEAIGAFNGWIGGSMSFTSNQERPVQPVRIYAKHIGRCGEYQDMRAAAARTGLVPTTCTLNSAEDHVWNEFWNKRWIHWDGAVDRPMMYENGWGKTISSVWNTRGDGHIWPVTPKYTAHCTYNATVLDSDGLPVDGALVRVSTENFYNPDLLTTTTWGSTDHTGTVSIPLGDNRNYWSAANSDTLGEDPVYGTTSIVEGSEADAVYNHTFRLPRAADALIVNPMEVAPDLTRPYEFEISYNVASSLVLSDNVYTGDKGDLFVNTGNIDLFLTDPMNYNLYSGNLPFSAFHSSTRTPGESLSMELSQGDYFTVLSNAFSQTAAKIVEINISVYSRVNIEFDQPVDGQAFSKGGLIQVSGGAFCHKDIDSVEIEFDGNGIQLPAEDRSSPEEPSYSYWALDMGTANMELGAHEIRARAYSGPAYADTWTTFKLVDLDPPAVTINPSVSNTDYYQGQSIPLSGTAEDNEEVTSLILVVIDAQQGPQAPLDITGYLFDGIWTYSLSGLLPGEHSIKVTAGDGAGNTAYKAADLTVIEGNPPTITITAPSSGTIIKKGNTVEFTGTARDDSGIQSLSFSINAGFETDITYSLDNNGAFSHIWDTDAAPEGPLTISIKALDPSGNHASESLELIVDAEEPALSFGFAEHKLAYSYLDPIILTGTAADDWELSELTLYIDDIPTADLTSEPDSRTPLGNWTYYLDISSLTPGTHYIRITAKDTAGHEISQELEFTADTGAPELTMDPIEEDRETPILIGESILITGNLEDDTGISNLTITIDGVPYSLTPKAGQWKHRLQTSSMKAGRHEITVTAEDLAGHTSTQRVFMDLLSSETADETPSEDGSSFSGTSVMIAVLAAAFIMIIAGVGIAVSKRN